MKIVITGSRSIQNQKLLANRFDIMFSDYARRVGLKENDKKITIYHGGATGTDKLIAQLFTIDGHTAQYDFRGRMFDVDLVVDPITTEEWQKYGTKAGPIRNGRLLDNEPDVVFAFWRAGDTKSKGTIDCVRQAASRGILVLMQVVSEVPVKKPDALFQ